MRLRPSGNTCKNSINRQLAVMENIWFSASRILGLSLMHSLWQGLLIYMFIKLLCWCIPAITSKNRYRLATGGLIVLTFWFIYTLIVQYSQVAASAKAMAHVNLNNILPFILKQHAAATEHRYYFDLNIYLPYITALYISGFVLNTGRLGYSWYNLHQIKSRVQFSMQLQQRLNNLMHHFNISQPIKAALSNLVDVPCITGYLKPILLIPVTLTTTLSAEEAEAILLHELAHISRHDYLLKVLQQIIDTLLFFNPFVHLLSRLMDAECEHSCDDLVVAVTGQPLTYAQALLKLESDRRQNLQLALAATGRKYYLFNRIQRIMKTQKNNVNLRPLLLSLLIISVSVSSIAWLNPKLENGRLSVKIEKPAPVTRLLADTVKKEKTVTRQNVRIKTDHHTPDKHTSNDPQLNALTAEVEKHADAIGKMYDGPEFQKYAEDLGKQGEELAASINTPQMQKLIAEQAELSANVNLYMARTSVNEKALNKEMEKVGAQIGEYYKSPRFLALSKELGEKSAKLSAPDVNSAEYKQNMAAMSQITKSIAEFNSSPEIQKLQKEISRIASQIVKPYNADYTRQQVNQKLLLDSISKIYNAEFARQNKINTDMMTEKIRKFQQGAEMQAEQQKLNEATQKLQTYMNSPAYKKTHKQEAGELYRPEKPEVKEQPEKP